MRVVFLGTPEFAVPSLRALVSAGHEVCAVYTRPDAVSGRGSHTRPSAVKEAALESGIPVRQPKTLRDDEELTALRALCADLLVVAAYGLILPPGALAAAPLGAVNVHASLLPRWRGAAPIQRAILAGDETAGVSIMRMEEGLDTGPFCCQVATPIGDAGAEELTARLAELGAEALAGALPAIASGTAEWAVQDESLVTYADKITRADVAVGPDDTAAQFTRKVRASSPAAPCKVLVAGRGVTILGVRASDHRVPAGHAAITKSALFLGVRDGTVEIAVLKPDGKRAMAASAWACGVRDLDGAEWTGVR